MEEKTEISARITLLMKIRSTVFRRKAYILAFLVPAFILLTAYIIFGVYPFGSRSVLALDFDAQYVYYFDYMYDVFAGKESIFYTWSGSLSGEFFGTFAYYLASPFNFIVWLFPRECITEGLMTMLLAKAAVSGLCCAVFLKNRRGFSDLTVILFSCMYALCGYFTAHTMNPMWLDGVLVLPLVITGVESICKGGKALNKGFFLYLFSLLYIFIANYYIGYMTGIFSALYFLYFLLCGQGGKKGEYIRIIFHYGFASVTAILLSGFIIVPAYKSLVNGKLSMGSGDFSPAENFNLGDILIKFFPGSYDTVRPEGLPMVYCGTLALVFAAAYFVLKKFPLRQRISSGVLLGIMLLSMYIKPVDMLWHGGAVPVWMPYRYAFIVSFLMIVFGAQTFENIKAFDRKVLGSVYLVLLGVLIFCDYIQGNEYFDTKLIIVAPIIALAAVGSAVMFYATKKSPASKVVLCSFAAAEVLFNTAYSLFLMNDDVYFAERSSYTDEISDTRSAVQQLYQQDDGFYRMEKTFHRRVNDPMALEMYGFSHSTSTFNEKVIRLLDNLGFGAREHYSRYDGATMLTDDIFGVKYVLSKYKCFVPYEDTVFVNSKNGIHAYVNTDAFDIACLASDTIIASEIDEESPFLFQQELASYMCGQWLNLFEPVTEFIFDSHNVNPGTTTDGHLSYKKRSSDEEAFVSYKLTVPKTGRVYAYFPSKYERECYLYVNGDYIKNYFENENHSIVYLGDYNKNETVEVQLKLLKDDVYFYDPEFYVLDEEALKDFNNRMSAFDSTLVRTGSASLEIEVNAPEESALFASIPLEEGWEAYIDGEKSDILPAVNDTLMCIRVPEGKHKITLSFFPSGMKTGLLLTACGAVLLTLFIIIRHIANRGTAKVRESNSEE